MRKDAANRMERRDHPLIVAPADIDGRSMAQMRPRTRRMTTMKRMSPTPPVGA
jgi:hypothetical protein